ncbi:MAG: hypothetical protein AB8F94_26230 [Saprospiraceae bacterium]
MKNHKTDSEILDDNYFPEEKTSKEYHFFKVVGHSAANTFLFIVLIILLFAYLGPTLFSFNLVNENVELVFVYLLASAPFLYHLRKQIKYKNLRDSNWKIWVCFLSLIGFMFVLLIIFLLSNLRIGID